MGNTRTEKGVVEQEFCINQKNYHFMFDGSESISLTTYLRSVRNDRMCPQPSKKGISSYNL